jgi:hypothetical protein
MNHEYREEQGMLRKVLHPAVGAARFGSVESEETWQD